MKVEVSHLTINDYLGLKESMLESYAAWGAYWRDHQIEHLLKLFPEGQLCIKVDGKLVGAALQLLIDYKSLGDSHTYRDATGDYTFKSHDADGDVLYGIEIFIGPEHRGLRLGRRLYDARKELCEKLNLRAIIAGARLPRYGEHADSLSPKEYIEKYRGKFDKGWDSLRNLRLNNLKALGIISKDVNGFAPSGVPKWESLNASQKKEYARTMEVYAAMVDYLDMSIGRIIDYLKQEGLYDNTMILFMSDNGANGAPASAYPGNGDGKYLSSFNNSLENKGLPGSLIDMGPGWAQASSSPLRMFKGFTAEGGIKAPLIVKMPSSGIKHEGEWNNSFIHVSDIMPTVLALAGANFPQEKNGTPLKQPIGISILPLLNGETTALSAEKGMGWELFEGKAYIKGNWKILRLGKPFGTGTWQLYDLAKDPGEINDLSQQFPAKRDSLINDWMQYAKENGVIDHKGLYDSFFQKSLGGKK